MRIVPRLAELRRSIRLSTILVIAVTTMSGCALTYVNKKTGALNVIGFAHVSVAGTKSDEASPVSKAVTISTVGVSISNTLEHQAISIGVDKIMLVSLATDSEGGSLALVNGRLLCATPNGSCAETSLNKSRNHK